MSDKKPVYLLAGGRPRNPETPDLLFQTVLGGIGVVSPRIAYVGVASGDDESFFGRTAGVLKAAGAGRVSHVLISPEGASLKRAQDILKSADIVFVSGGDVDRGVRVLREKNMAAFLVELYEQGTPFLGVSAGSIMLAKEWVRWRDPEDNKTAELFPCLGLAPIICDTHDEQGGWQELKAALRLEEDKARGYGIVTGTAIRVFPDGGVEAIGGATHQYVRHGRKVERAPDILPACS